MVLPSPTLGRKLLGSKVSLVAFTTGASFGSTLRSQLVGPEAKAHFAPTHQRSRRHATGWVLGSFVPPATNNASMFPRRVGIVTFPDGTYFKSGAWYPSPSLLGFYR